MSLKPSLQRQNAVKKPKTPENSAKRFKSELEEKQGFAKAANAFIEKAGEEKARRKAARKALNLIAPLSLLIPDRDAIDYLLPAQQSEEPAVSEATTPEPTVAEPAVSAPPATLEPMEPEPVVAEPTAPPPPEHYCCTAPPINVAKLPFVTLYMCPRCANDTSQKYAIQFSNHVHQTFVFCNKCIDINYRIANVLSQ